MTKVVHFAWFFDFFSTDGVFQMPSSAEYTRYSHSHELERYWGKKGVVYSISTVHHPSAGSEYPVKAPAGFEALAPYDIALIEFPDGSRRTFMAMSSENLQTGDEVECVVGVNPATDEGILPYKNKVRHPILKIISSK